MEEDNFFIKSSSSSLLLYSILINIVPDLLRILTLNPRNKKFIYELYAPHPHPYFHVRGASLWSDETNLQFQLPRNWFRGTEKKYNGFFFTV